MAETGKETSFDARAFIRDALSESIATKQALCETGTDIIVAIAERFTDALADGHKLLFCGNGGSAALDQALPKCTHARDEAGRLQCRHKYWEGRWGGHC